jgi:hypothetical protein
VDIKRGNTAIKAMAQQFDYVTIIDAFMASNSLEDVKKLDLNERVRRIIEQRFPDFERWIKESEIELRKRFEIETKYLRSQVNSLRLYAKWIKPYLRSAQKLEQKAEATADLVTFFNTALFELVLMNEAKYNPIADVQSGELPNYFLKINSRKYNSIILVEFNFRGAPDRSDQRGGYGFRGRSKVVFTSYSLNDEELKVLKQELEKDDLGDSLKLIEGVTEDSLAEIQKDIEEFLDEKPKEEEEETKKSEDVNPFAALLGLERKNKKQKKKSGEKDLSKGITSDGPEEKIMRSKAALMARWNCRKLYRMFKASLGMPSLPPVFR